MSLTETIRIHVCEHHSEMLTDLLLALVWATVVSILFDVLDRPQWTLYLCMGAGIVAYFGFFTLIGTAGEKR